MELLAAAQEIAGMDPLPDDAEEQVQAMASRAKSAERELIGQLFEALIVARSRGA